MPVSAGKRTCHAGASAIAELQRIEEALGHYRHLANLLTFVNGRKGAAMTLAAAAQAIGISPSHLTRLLHEKVGTSFHNWLTLRRIHAAMRLMRERPLTAQQAAHMAGFASYRSFARAFKVVVGISPSVYRNQVEQVYAARFAEN